ncbi:hypothetical protein BZL30_2942 [Mycobacterium kansasii]|uniref:Uncharacterized protein n=1 Tax=Mycobacterium kansasii TaxID=1768 RepID=A0A1V3XLF9_MYCKA|nr:hypothetical protein BZL30_2942 [Mycobacterium kansasii]
MCHQGRRLRKKPATCWPEIVAGRLRPMDPVRSRGFAACGGASIRLAKSSAKTPIMPQCRP